MNISEEDEGYKIKNVGFLKEGKIKMMKGGEVDEWEEIR